MKTKVLDDDETLQHRKSVFGRGGKWKCESCGFEEPCVLAWQSRDGGDIRLSCHECHLYEDPIRYQDEVALAYLPLISRRTLAHLVRLMLVTSQAKVGTDLAEALSKGDADAHVKSLVTRIQAGLDPTLSSAEKKAKLVKAIDEAVKEAIGDVGKNISYGLKYGAAMFPDKAKTLRVFADGAKDVVEEIGFGLRLIPTNIRWSRLDLWNQGVVADLLAEVVTFATEYVPVSAEVLAAVDIDTDAKEAETEQASIPSLDELYYGEDK
jgi:hypothetical protein